MCLKWIYFEVKTKVAIIGSRNIAYISLDDYVPANTTEIIAGGAVGVDCCAAKYAKQMGIKLIEFLPEYKRYGRAAPILRNQEIVNYADKILVFLERKFKRYTIGY